MKVVRCVIAGDSGCGKSSLLLSYTTNAVPQEYIPTVFDNYSAHVVCKGTIVHLTLWDIGGNEEFANLRPLSFRTADVFIVAFSLAEPKSLEHLESRWIRDIIRLAPANTPWILAGCKSDLRIHPLYHGRLSPSQAGRECAEKLGAQKYIEVSAWNQEGLHDLFTSAIQSVHKLERKSRCTIL